ncbi:MAG: hypothetical protein O3A51_03530 [Verrucomicrobia bacterium]|nr:hypothetical protein [Verrucomicrobiota bacterium]
MKATRRFANLVIAGGVLFAQAASACTVCMGATEAHMGRGVRYGILALVAIIATVLTSFAIFFVKVARRTKDLSACSNPAA